MNNFGMTREKWREWLEKYGDDPVGCIACGAMAGCCDAYPNCPGNEEWRKVEARRITTETFACSMEIGKTLPHPDGRMVKIIGGKYWGEHGLSNFWYWREVMPDGSLAATEECGYGW
jgi:hypothetical protein